MLRVKHHLAGAGLLDHALGLLEARPAEHNLLLGICAELGESRVTQGGPPYLVTVDEAQGPIAAAVQVPPNNLVLSCASPAALSLIVDDLVATGRDLPGVIATAATAATFADLWTRAREVRATISMQQGIYQSQRVQPPVGVPGVLRPAARDDLDFLLEWALGFAQDAHLPEQEHARVQDNMKTRIDRKSIFLWEDGEPVSMAAHQAPIHHGVRVSFVYTPLMLRGKGYASACVAALTGRLLDAGCKFCCLYTDLANPTSNRIYQQIGYHLIARSAVLRFDAK
jgi:predicted GNAT family acetyltransferase